MSVIPDSDMNDCYPYVGWDDEQPHAHEFAMLVGADGPSDCECGVTFDDYEAEQQEFIAAEMAATES